ncbi:hypothetical protein [Calothrix rhizosoleniae]|uniref:arginine synthesis PII-interacting regulator PirA n=1 Tax=Calothrix rhizosoleniae TaxID=888997 RepID=UPI00190EC021|nr:hypothetical protein [Calothrix rhizosoleniae]
MHTKRGKVVNNMREVHKQNIQKNLEHRLQVARDKGDMGLIRQLEAEMKHFQ